MTRSFAAAMQPVLIDGTWRPAAAVDSYRAFDPSAGATHEAVWPVSGWADVDAALEAAARAAAELARPPVEATAAFLNRYAERIAGRADEIVAAAHAETGLAIRPRLLETELPRTLDQLRQAAMAAQEAHAAVRETGLPPATVQLVHGLTPADGLRLVADPRVGATGFTGGREAGQVLFAAASAAGRVIWVEMGSVNPVVLLPGALAERGAEIAGELTASVTGSAGQFCTKPGLAFFVDDEAGRAFVSAAATAFAGIGAQVLLGPTGRDRLRAAIGRLRAAGARLFVGDEARNPGGGGPCVHTPTLLEVTAAELVADPDHLVVEAFGNATVLVRCGSLAELGAAVSCVGGALGASVYLARSGVDDAAFAAVGPLLVARAGRVIENRMPTGLAVVPPMQHGGPWPSAGPPFFSAVGFPWTMLRFARRVCFDGVSWSRLPEVLRDQRPPGRPWRFIDGGWTRG